jgi:hypothetical protein
VALPAGLALDEATGLVSGTPSELVRDCVVLVLCVGPGGEEVVELLINVSVFPPQLEFRGPELVLRLGADMEPVLPHNAGSPAELVTATGLPRGVAIDHTTGQLSGRPEELCRARRVVISAHNSAGHSATELLLTVVDGPPSIQYAPLQLVAGAHGATMPTNSGGEADSFRALAALPEGLALDGATGEVSGAVERPGEFSVRIEAANPAGKRAADLHVSVSEAPPRLSYPPLTLRYGEPFGPVRPEVTGGALRAVYAPQLPEGVELGADGSLSGVPTHPGHYALEVVAENAGGQTAAALDVRVLQPVPVVRYPELVAVERREVAPLVPRVAGTVGRAPCSADRTAALTAL